MSPSALFWLGALCLVAAALAQLFRKQVSEILAPLRPPPPPPPALPPFKTVLDAKHAEVFKNLPQAIEDILAKHKPDSEPEPQIRAILNAAAAEYQLFDRQFPEPTMLPPETVPDVLAKNLAMYDDPRTYATCIAALDDFAKALTDAYRRPTDEGFILYFAPVPLTTLQLAHHAYMTEIKKVLPLAPRPLVPPLLEKLSKYGIPVYMPEKTLDEHIHIVAPSGHGKTQLLQLLVYSYLPDVLDGRRSIIVIDSQRNMISKLARLKDFVRHPDKLVVINPHNPPALNLFASTAGNANIVRETYKYIINSILVSDLTGMQDLVLDSLIAMMMNVKDGSIKTLIKVLQAPKEFPEEYRYALDGLRTSTREFLEQDLYTAQYRPTREQVVRRLRQILNIGTFDDMLSASDMSLDLAAEMAQGKLILIDTDSAFLTDEYSSIFGAFFMGLLYRAIMSRTDKDTPCLCIIDEAYEYLKHNASVIEGLLVKARKCRVGLVLSHQFPDQLKEIYSAVSTNTATKIAGGAAPEDYGTIASMLRIEKENVKWFDDKFKFGIYVRNLVRSAILYEVEPGVLESEDMIPEEEYEAMKSRKQPPPVTPPPRRPPPPVEDNLSAKEY